MKSRPEGMIAPSTFTVTVDDPTIVLSEYTWAVQAARRSDPTTELFVMEDIAGTSTGFKVVWTEDDLGSLSVSSGSSETFRLEFTGTRAGRDDLKFQRDITITREIPVGA